MKKLYFIFLSLIFLLFPLPVSASSLALTAESVTMLSDGIEYLAYSGGVPYGFIPFLFLNSDANKTYQVYFTNTFQKSDLFDVDTSELNYRRLTTSEQEEYEGNIYYDGDGNLVSLSDLFFCQIDNKYFTETFYTDSNGNIVYNMPDKSSACLNVKFGGSDISDLQWQDAYNNLSDVLDDCSYIYAPNNNISGVNLSYYLHGGRVSNGRKTEWVIFVPNIYSRGVSVASSYTNGQSIPNVYFNDGSGIYYKAINTNGGQPFQVLNSPVTKDGFTYAHNWQESTYVSGSNNSRTAFDSGTTGRYNFSLTSFTYNPSLQDTYSDSVSYKKVNADSNTIDFSSPYSYDSLSDYYSDIANTPVTYNPDFSSSSAINALNYPLSISISDAIVDDVISFPNSIDTVYDPSIDYPLNDTIDPSLINNNIPIISDLQNKFPFSIPWDIYNIIHGLEVSRETPVLDFTISFPVIDYDWDISIDLSMYDDTAELCRLIFLILFIIGLAVFSYSHFFGS